MKNSSKVLSLVGLATRAGKTVSGEFSTEKSVKTGKGFLVLVAEDASENMHYKLDFPDTLLCFLIQLSMVTISSPRLRAVL